MRREFLVRLTRKPAVPPTVGRNEAAEREGEAADREVEAAEREVEAADREAEAEARQPDAPDLLVPASSPPRPPRWAPDQVPQKVW